ncbi:phenoloxidase-activating factor 1 [Hyalella azteca]|uniref:Phenoloxidase-activating factor 1 n=1 Tax=Hyalella azteca TaxID=294128 RepID=A0A8B7NJ57_HYAAZ|nr:phenoloxidase-activating factor 1 [Hyalella azteca]
MALANSPFGIAGIGHISRNPRRQLLVVSMKDESPNDSTQLLSQGAESDKDLKDLRRQISRQIYFSEDLADAIYQSSRSFGDAENLPEALASGDYANDALCPQNPVQRPAPSMACIVPPAPGNPSPKPKPAETKLCPTTTTVMTNLLDLTVVRLGEHNLVKNPDCSSSFCAPEPLDFGISSVIRHPSFNTRGALSDDVAVLKLDKTVDFSSISIQPVCLPSPGLSAEAIIQGRQVIVIGFGDTEAGVRSHQLLEVLLPYVPMQQCRMVANYSSLAANGQVCLGGNFQMDSCFKDSGGPAMVTTTNTSSQYLQVGIVSFGTQSCGVENVPAIYTDVAYYRNWIVSQLSA